MFSSIPKILLIVFGVLIISISAQMAIQLPDDISPIPITGQSLAVLIIAHFLKNKWGTICIISYIVLGCLGLPIFSDFSGGYLQFIGPSFGYFIGFIIASLVIGTIALKGEKGFIPLFLQQLLGTVIILLLGSLGLLRYHGLEESFQAGFSPFLLGGFIKILLASLFLFVFHKLRNILNNKQN